MDLSFHQLTCALRKVLLWYPTRNLIGISNLVGVDVGGLVVVAYVNGPVDGRGRFWDNFTTAVDRVNDLTKWEVTLRLGLLASIHKLLI